MTVAAILGSKGVDVIVGSTDQPVRDVVALIASRRIGAVPVVDLDGIVVGVLSERDVLYRLASDGASILDKKAAEVMTAPAITITRQTDVLQALAMMTRKRIRHLPVVEDGRLLGIVSIGDLVKFRIDRIEAEANAMRAYIQSV